MEISIKYKLLILILFVIFIVISAGCAEKKASAGAENATSAEETSVGQANVSENATAEGTPAKDYFENYLEEYEKAGKIVFKVPEKMEVNKTEVTIANITRNFSEKSVGPIEENQTYISTNITVTPKILNSPLIEEILNSPLIEEILNSPLIEEILNSPPIELILNFIGDILISEVVGGILAIILAIRKIILPGIVKLYRWVKKSK